MDLTAVASAVATADAVVPVGARTQFDVGDRVAVAPSTEVRAPAGIVRHEPGDLTITVGAGTSFAEVDAALTPYGQECPLDPRDPSATIGGILASGLSGPRRLGLGPVRDHVLEVRFVTGDARVVKGGGPTVKNVTGYDLPRLLVGSLGTLGVIGRVTLRCRPRPAWSRWFRTYREPRVFRPSAHLWDGTVAHVLLEGPAADAEAQARGLDETGAPALPDGPHRGRISVAPGRARALGAALATVAGVRWCAELGVGTVHVACDDASLLASARAIAHDHGGWLLREAGGDGIDGFGRALPNLALLRRVKAAFDPDRKLAPGRLPL